MLKFKDAKKGKYTLVVKDKKGKYADMSADFMLQTEDMPATYNAEKTALVTADGFKAEDLQEYVKSITSVSVNGTIYAASGHGATVIVNEDGSIKTDAAPFANGAGDYQIVVSATGYKDLEFTYTVAASKEEYKYVYAGLSWAEYWAAEGVYLAEGSNLTSSSDVTDKKGELDKGAFDTVSRATTNHGLHRGSYQCTAVIYDTDGKEYLDFAAGFAVTGLGYDNKELNEALKKQIDKLYHTSNLYYHESCGEAAEALNKVSGMDRVFFTNSGGEANEGALKAARRYAYTKGSGRYEFIAMENSFHGRSLERYRLQDMILTENLLSRLFRG